MRLVHIVVDAVGLSAEALFEFLIGVGALSEVFDEALDFAVLFVLPRVGVAPVVAEVVLHHFHLLFHGLFGILLHAAIHSGVDFQAVGVKVVASLLAPRLQFLSHSLAEVECLAVVGRLDAVVELYVEVGERVIFLLSDVVVAKHIAEHHVAALKASLWVEARVVGRSGFE